jgi:hypothetical protein
MLMRVSTSLLFFSLTLLSCRASDRTITHGADGEADWSRRLAAAIPIGLSRDSARAIMEANGFQCRERADSVAYVWCSKTSSPSGVVRRRWSAVLNLDQNHVFEVRGFTGLVGP